jgi:hypothetical protein
MLKNFEDFI